MVDQAFVAKLTAEIGEAQRRVVAQTAKVERSAGDELIEETATLRNVVMQLEGLKLKLKTIEALTRGDEMGQGNFKREL